MRLDHLLSKESGGSQLKLVLRIRTGKGRVSIVFNFEGPVKRNLKVNVSGAGTGNRGGIAQLGEHLLCKQGVKGSIPFISTIMGS